MHVITSNEALQAACAALAQAPFVALDTEFLRETTYWPKLCLVQAAGGEVEAIIDPLAEGLDLQPLIDLLLEPSLLKVFHAARQDIEIFVKLAGRPPAAIFDTQIAAMALGHGDSIAYDALVQAILKRRVDKTSRFTDWSQRPLSPDQLKYALGDVTHLRDLFPLMREELDRLGRFEWVRQEMDALLAPALYDTDPDLAWMRLKPRRFSAEYLAALKTACAWRETTAQSKNVPRARVLKDDALYEIAEQRPRTSDAMNRLRAAPKGFGGSRGGIELAGLIDQALKDPHASAPKIERDAPLPNGLGPVVELLKVLLRIEAERHNVAPRLIATVADLERIAADDAADTPALTGWRRTVFGERALALKHGRIALTLKGKKVDIVERDLS